MEIYNPRADKLSSLPIPQPLTSGGDLSTGATGVPSSQWPSSNSWGILNTTGHGPASREDPCVAIDQNSSKLIVFGGQDSSDILGDIYILDLDSLQWTKGPSASDGRVGMACALFDDGFLVWGGASDPFLTALYSPRPSVFNVTSLQWTDSYKTANISTPVQSVKDTGGKTDVLALSLGLTMSALGLGAIGIGIFLYRREKKKSVKSYGRILMHTSKGLQDPSSGLPAQSPSEDAPIGAYTHETAIPRPVHRRHNEREIARRSSRDRLDWHDGASVQSYISGKYYDDDDMRDEEEENSRLNSRYERRNERASNHSHKIELGPMAPDERATDESVLENSKHEDPTFIPQSRAQLTVAPQVCPIVPRNQPFVEDQEEERRIDPPFNPQYHARHSYHMDNTSALEEESLAIVSIYGLSSFYPLAGTATSPDSPPVYTLKVSLEDPNFDFDAASNDEPQNSNGTNGTNGNFAKNRKELEFRIYFPEGYPETNSSAPVHEIVSIYYGTLRLTDSIIQEIDQGLDQCFVPGEVVVFSWIEWLRNFLEELEACIEDDSLHGNAKTGHDEDSVDQGSDGEDSKDEDEDESHSSEAQRTASDYFSTDDFSQDPQGSAALSSSLASLSLLHSPASPSDNHSLRVPRVSGTPEFTIRSGPPIVDRKSVFVAHLAPITQPTQVPLMIQQLKQENKKVIKATHNIMAFRVENDNGTLSQDNDDDGETAAGSRLLHLMSILDVKNVVVVVSRWYGGIPLSADRFKHINNAARLLLDECGYIKPAASSEAASNVNSKKKGHSKKAGKR
ncbi:hypothetical protein BGX26_012311 [Mortierella sp. AD094]|nr:hypothetical protein BGX26_012311 [Mortierella sp. AD094]